MRKSQKGAIAAGHRLTAEAGAAMLHEGGSAIDAAIAALAMACVCEPVLASPGGGGFAMIRDGASGKTTLLDFFPQTPLRKRGDVEGGYQTIEADFGTTTQIFHIGPATVATPGFLDGLEALAQQGARLPHQDHFAPAIAAASTGVEITRYQAYLSTVVAPILMATAASRKVFAPGGNLQRAGEKFHNPALAETFQILGQTRWRQTGIPAVLLNEQAAGGHITEPDIFAYRVEERCPLPVMAGDAKIFLNPLPAASGTLVQYALRHLETCTPLALAKALEEADKARCSARGDLSVLLDRPLRQNGTTHISTVDTDGNACAVTISNGTGSGDMADGCGFMLNNILGEEDVNPNGACGWRVNVRPASMMCPALIDMPGGGLIALGSGGSSRIRSAVFQVVARLCLDGTDIHAAVKAPRLHVENSHLDVEALFNSTEITELVNAFHDHRLWPEQNMFFGGIHAVASCGGANLTGAGDARRGGVFMYV